MSCFFVLVSINVQKYKYDLFLMGKLRSSKRLANFQQTQQTSSKCIQNTRANAGRLLEVCWVCWKFARRLLDRINTLMTYMYCCPGG